MERRIHDPVRSAEKVRGIIVSGKGSVDFGGRQRANTTSRVHLAQSIAPGRNQNSVQTAVQGSKVVSQEVNAVRPASQPSIPARSKQVRGAASLIRSLVMRHLITNAVGAWPREGSPQRRQLFAMP